MELKKGDLVRHKNHNIGYGIVLSEVHPYKSCMACKVEWVKSTERHIIDVDFLDKVNKS